MKVRAKQSGVTLPEVLTVIVIVVFVSVISMPVIDTFFDSMASQGSAEAMISAALSSARAMATSEHTYVGIRFQKIYDPLISPIYADQYMIFIVYDYDRTDLANGFRAVEGMKPIKMPENFGVMDLYYGSVNNGYGEIGNDLTNANLLNDATTFSMVFSPSGKLIVHNVQIRNRNGQTNDSSFDDIFNTRVNVEETKIAMFYQDDYPNDGFMIEPSRREFLIYDNREFRRAYIDGRPVTGYLGGLTPFHINPYTGTIISQGQ